MFKTKDFKKQKGSIDNSTYFIGKCAIYGDRNSGDNIAIIAPNIELLKAKYENLFAQILNIKYVQDVAIFQLKNVKTV